MSRSVVCVRAWFSRLRKLRVPSLLLLVVAASLCSACSGQSGPGERVGSISLPIVSVSGTVRDEKGAAVSDVAIELRLGSGSVVGSALSGADGSYLLVPIGADIPDGTYDLVVTPPDGATYVRQVFPNHLLAGSSTFDVVLVSVQSRNVTGTLVGSDGEPISGLTVCLSAASSVCAEPSGEDGTFGLVVLDGSHTLQVYGYLYPASGGYTSLDLWGRSAIEVTGDRPLDLVLPTRALGGQVVDPDGIAAAGASVSASFSLEAAEFSGGWYGSASTGADGGFSFRGFEGGGRLSVTASGYPPVTRDVLASESNVIIDLVRGRTITGTLVGSDGEPISGLTVCLSAASSVCAEPSGEDGTFGLVVLDGSHALQVYGYLYPASGGYTSLDLWGRSAIEVTGDRPLDLVLPTRGFGGQVVDPDGIAAAGASMSASFSLEAAEFSGGWYGSASTGSDGRFRFSAFQGTGTVSISPPNSLGLSTLVISSVTISSNHVLGVSLQFLTESASETVFPSETVSTDDEDDGATRADPVETTVRVPAKLENEDIHQVSIREVPVTETPPLGYYFMTQQISITAPGSADPLDPLVITFRIDCSRFYPAACDDVTRDGVEIFRNARLAPDPISACNSDDEPGRVAPNPCIEGRAIVDDDVTITVLTSAASEWNFGFRLAGDTDGDRIRNADDACPERPEDLDGHDDTDGCPEIEDRDGDGVDDLLDACPDQPEDADGHDDDDGCPEFDDADADGIEDFQDACPTDPEDLDGHADTDGCPEIEDSDGDGIADLQDACPTDPEDLDGHADTDGCPETEPAPKRCADFDGDGRVTLRDLNRLRSRIGAKRGSRTYREAFDLNENGFIGYLDVLLAFQQLGRRCRLP